MLQWLPLPCDRSWPSHSWWCHWALPPGWWSCWPRSSRRFAFRPVSECEDTARIQSHLVISRATHRHSTMPVASLVLMEGKNPRFWWTTSGCCHTFQGIKNYNFLTFWESRTLAVSLLYLWKKPPCPWISFSSCFFLRVQCRVTYRLQA